MTIDKTRSNHERNPEEPEAGPGQGWSGWDARSMAKSRLAPPVNAAVVADILSQSSEAEVPQKTDVDPDLDSTHDPDAE